MSCCFLECSLVYPAEEDRDRYAEEPILGYENEVEYRKLKCTLSIAKILSSLRRLRHCICSKGTRRRCRKCCWFTLLLILILFLVIFTVLFVILPLPFKNSIEFQRSLIFHPVVDAHDAYDVSSTSGVNFANSYLTVKSNLQIGLWNVSSNRYYKSGTRPTLIHFHKEKGDRLKHQHFYTTYSQTFNVIAFDYRSYGDSSTFDLVEDGLVDDAVYLYKWVLNKTKGDIYVWGDELGAAISTHAIARLRNDAIIPTGLILQNPFTSLSELITTWYWPFGKIFSWMPWYDAFITKPLIKNGLSFNTSNYITKVDCPIFVLNSYYHGNVDELVNKVSAIAANRDPLSQGSVTVNRGYHGSEYYYDQYSSPSSEINDFMAECSIHKQNRPKNDKLFKQ